MSEYKYKYKKYLPEYAPVMRKVICMKCEQEVELQVPLRICAHCTKSNLKASKRAGVETGMKRHHGAVQSHS